MRWFEAVNMIRNTNGGKSSAPITAVCEGRLFFRPVYNTTYSTARNSIVKHRPGLI